MNKQRHLSVKDSISKEPDKHCGHVLAEHGCKPIHQYGCIGVHQYCCIDVQPYCLMDTLLQSGSDTGIQCYGSLFR
jgi:hypothetical protein